MRQKKSRGTVALMEAVVSRRESAFRRVVRSIVKSFFLLLAITFLAGSPNTAGAEGSAAVTIPTTVTSAPAPLPVVVTPDEQFLPYIRMLSDPESSPKDLKKAIEFFGNQSDIRLIALLDAYSKDSLAQYVADESSPKGFWPVLAINDRGIGTTTDKEVDLVDPLTQLPVSEDGKPLTINADLYKREEALVFPTVTNSQRGLVNIAITALRLKHPDPLERRKAIIKAGDWGDRNNEKMAPRLEELAKIETDKRNLWLIEESLTRIALEKGGAEMIQRFESYKSFRKRTMEELADKTVEEKRRAEVQENIAKLDAKFAVDSDIPAVKATFKKNRDELEASVNNAEFESKRKAGVTEAIEKKDKSLTAALDMPAVTAAYKAKRAPLEQRLTFKKIRKKNKATVLAQLDELDKKYAVDSDVVAVKATFKAEREQLEKDLNNPAFEAKRKLDVQAAIETLDKALIAATDLAAITTEYKEKKDALIKKLNDEEIEKARKAELQAKLESSEKNYLDANDEAKHPEIMEMRKARHAAATKLGDMQSLRSAERLKDAQTAEFDQSYAGLYTKAMDKIANWQRVVDWTGYVFSGLSSASILIFMALGLAIIFGLMGVINMAHGELMMVGAYATYEVQLFFQAHWPGSMDWYFPFAIPVAFLTAAIVGIIIEATVIRFLYGRPLDTLLATFGVSYVLIQIARTVYGNNIGVKAPTWLQGSWEPVLDIRFPYNRLFIIAFCIGCVLLMYFIINRTRLGLLLRATTQNRSMAASCGVSTRKIDMLTFALGSGLAGMAGCALSQVDGVTPDMGQNYIIESFLVVVVGGVGKLAGAIWSGLGLGMIRTWMEPFAGAIWAKVIVLTLVIVFIQRKPSGLFPAKGRLADV